jgi:hypothetical protein
MHCGKKPMQIENVRRIENSFIFLVHVLHCLFVIVSDDNKSQTKTKRKKKKKLGGKKNLKMFRIF